MYEVCVVIGARPNFIKAWALLNALKSDTDFIFHLVHSGQHYDDNLSAQIINQLNFPSIDTQMVLADHSSASTRYSSLHRNFSKFFTDNRFDAVIVFGDVNTTVAASLSAKAKQQSVVHVESGLRSHDVTMPEEINRIIVDNISDLLITTEAQANINLKTEGFEEQRIKFCGNLMIETLLRNELQWKKETDYKFELLITAHRAELIYNAIKLTTFVSQLAELSKRFKIVFPMHPATKSQMKKLGLYKALEDKIMIIEPQSYFSFLTLLWNCKGVLTDSGGIQEEAVYLGKPIITLRSNTERPVTLETGLNTLANIDDLSTKFIEDIIYNKKHEISKIQYWDDKVSARILQEIKELIKK